jgi:uncharacterized protein YihD (DUF1040 family)
MLAESLKQAGFEIELIDLTDSFLISEHSLSKNSNE